MAINHRRLVELLGAAVAKSAEGGALDALVAALTQETDAAGATFLEYGPRGGRVVAAAGAMEFALGRPVPPEVVEAADVSGPLVWVRPVDTLPNDVVEALGARDVCALASQPVSVGGRAVGMLHLYFRDPCPCERHARGGSRGGADARTADGGADTWDELRNALLVAGSIAAQIVSETSAVPQARASVDDDDDRALFLAVAGHELRTPVTVIKGYASMLADRWDSIDESSRRDAARVLTQRADQLARLVDRILAASVGDGIDGPMRLVSFDLAEALRRATDDLPAELRSVLRLDVPDNLPPVLGDPTVLTSIVAELVTNATRARQDDADDDIEIVAGADETTVFIRVCDRGVGIRPSDVERAFERFWRARPGRDGGGVGLGLFLVRRLAERQHGWVSLRPRTGGGTIAEVRLRRAGSAPARV